MISLPRIYSQNDPGWRSQKLGTSQSTIGNEGCYVATYANLATYYGKNVNVAQMNNLLIQNGGFFMGNRIASGDVLSWIYSDIKYRTRGLNFPMLRDYLSRGYPVILDIKTRSALVPGGSHFVLAIGWSDNQSDMKIADPWDGTVQTVGKYGAINEMFFFEGPKPTIHQPIIQDNQKIMYDNEKAKFYKYFEQLKQDKIITPEQEGWVKARLDVDGPFAFTELLFELTGGFGAYNKTRDWIEKDSKHPIFSNIPETTNQLITDLNNPDPFPQINGVSKAFWNIFVRVSDQKDAMARLGDDLENLKKTSIQNVEDQARALKDKQQELDEAREQLGAVPKPDETSLTLEPTEDIGQKLKFSVNKFMIGLAKRGVPEMFVAATASTLTGIFLKLGLDLPSEVALAFTGSLLTYFGIKINPSQSKS